MTQWIDPEIQPIVILFLDRSSIILFPVMMSTDAQTDLLFEALIVPNRSLTRRGWCWLILGLLGATGLTVLRFWLLGAWPVAVFAVLEVGLFLTLFWVHARAGRQMELLLLSPSSLRVVRIDHRGRRDEQQLQPGWLNVVLQERAGRVPTLLLTSHGRRDEIARSLGEAEKRDLAVALEAALHDLRNPRFDNPQLREPA